MSSLAIKTVDLGKRYKLGATVDLSRTFREALLDLPKRFMSKSKRLALEMLERAKADSNYDPETPKGTFWALKDINLEIKHGDVVGIIGRNGAGKSTLLKVLSRITAPTKGYAEIHGRVGSLLEVGTGFHWELTGRENIFLSGAVMGMRKSEIQRKFDEIVSFAEIDDFLDTPVKRYSSGMYVRLAFAVAAHLEPEILIVDEVLAVGDMQFQKKCLGKMSEVSKEGRTVLFVSHNMESILRLCNKGLLLNNGKTILNENIATVVDYYVKSNVGTVSSVKWNNLQEAPGNDFIKIMSAKVITEDGEVKDSFDITKPIGIYFEYSLLEQGHIFTHGITLHNETGINILNSHDVVSNTEIRTNPRKMGRYSATMWIPGNFLSEGNIVVGIAFLKQNPLIIHYYKTDILHFNVVDYMEGFSARGEYTSGWPGVVRPLLNWTSEILNPLEQ